MTASNKTKNVIALAKLAALAAPALSATSLAVRNQAIENFAQIINQRRKDILAANQIDAQGQDAADFKAGRMSIDNSKIDTVITGCRTLIAMSDPLGQVDYGNELDSDLSLYRVSCPIGVIGVIFEARPDVLPQIAALALKSGNVILLKGGQEVEATNKVLFECLQEALKQSALPSQCATLLESRAEVAILLQADKFVDLIIPRGSNSLVSYIQANTKIPVLGHAEGICHVYIHNSADLNKALRVVIDAKVDYPEACNTIETLLLDKALPKDRMVAILTALSGKHVKLRLDSNLAPLAQSSGIDFEEAEEKDWLTEYGNLCLSAKIVDNIDAAILHINEFGSGHTDAIICEDTETWNKFFNGVKSAGVYHNASTRFADGFRYGFGAEVGISTGKLPPRGPVGLQGLITYKYKLEGNGHIVSDYHGAGAKTFTHRNLL